MACRRNEIQQSMHSVVPEPRVSLDTRLLRQNVVVLALQVVDNLLEAGQRYERTGVKTAECALTQIRCQCYPQIQGYRRWSGQCGHPPLRALSRMIREMAQKKTLEASPTLTGLILTFSSAWALSGLSSILWFNTSDSQRVFTKVVRPFPEAPKDSCEYMKGTS